MSHGRNYKRERSSQAAYRRHRMIEQEYSENVNEIETRTTISQLPHRHQLDTVDEAVLVLMGSVAPKQRYLNPAALQGTREPPDIARITSSLHNIGIYETYPHD